MTLPQKEREAAEKAALEAHAEIEDTLALKWEYNAAFTAGWSACLRESPTVKQLHTALMYSHDKLDHYRRKCGNEYVGGVEFSCLMKMIEESIASLSALEAATKEEK